jgi:hypothetical protein
MWNEIISSFREEDLISEGYFFFLISLIANNYHYIFFTKGMNGYQLFLLFHFLLCILSTRNGFTNIKSNKFRNICFVYRALLFVLLFSTLNLIMSQEENYRWHQEL